MTVMESPAAVQVAENLTMLLFRAEMSQRAVCRSIGMSPTTLHHKMKGHSAWSLSDLESLARELDVTVPELTGTLPNRDDWLARRASVIRQYPHPDAA